MLGLLLLCVLFTISTLPSVRPSVPPWCPHRSCIPPHVWAIKHTLSQRTFGPVVQLSYNACLKCAFCSSLLFISNLLFQFSVPRLGGGWLLFICISQNEIFILYAFPSRSYGFSQCKWYLGLDFHSRLLLLRGKANSFEQSSSWEAIYFSSTQSECWTRLLMHWSKSASVRNLSRLQLSFMWLNS